METKLYISLKEAENLAVNKILSIHKSRSGVKRAQGDLSIAIIFDAEDTIITESYYYIFFSAVEKFEIPDQDYKIFSVNLELPIGLLKTTKRKYKDNIDPSQLNIEEPDAHLMLMYSKIRRGLVSWFSGVSFSKNSFTLCYQDFLNLDEFVSRFLRAITHENSYPTSPTGRLPNYLKDRWAWWGQFIRDNLFHGASDEEMQDLKEWLIKFNPDSNIDYKILETTCPKRLKQYYTFVIGYYKACQDDEVSNGDRQNERLQFWHSFFRGAFKDDVDYMHPISSLRKCFLYMEKHSYEISSSIMEGRALQLAYNSFDILLPKEDVIKQYHELDQGCNYDSIELIHELDILASFQTGPLHGSNRKQVGEILEANEGRTGLDNYIILDGQSFLYFQKDQSTRPIFYGEISKNRIPRNLSIKVKPLSKLVSDQRKYIVLKSTNAQLPNIVDLYGKISLKRAAGNFQKVLVVNFESGHQTEFVHDIDKQASLERELKTLFENSEISVVRYCPTTGNMGEIKKWFRNHLSTARLNQIEVIDDDFNYALFECLISAFPKYAVVKKGPAPYFWWPSQYRPK